VAAIWLSFVFAAAGLLLVALAVLGLEWSGGAARDTSIVVAIAALAVTDFWAGGAMRAVTGLPLKPNLVCWMTARSAWLILIAIIFPAFALVIPVQIALAAAAFVAGTRFADTMRKSTARTAT
jgi:hypothetical protein